MTNQKQIYPYFYGDEGKGKAIAVSNTCWKVLLITVFATSSISLLPMAANAIDGTEILIRIEKQISELDGSSPYTKGISPVGALVCMVSGVCVAKTKQAVYQGNFPAAVAFGCGAVITFCSDRVAAYKGY